MTKRGTRKMEGGRSKAAHPCRLTGWRCQNSFADSYPTTRDSTRLTLRSFTHKESQATVTNVSIPRKVDRLPFSDSTSLDQTLARSPRPHFPHAMLYILDYGAGNVASLGEPLVRRCLARPD